MTYFFDAIIIGAGPAGSAAAILLAKAGWSVAVLEKQRFPRRKVCGECIAASNFALLDALGVGNAFSELAGPALRRVALMHGEDAVFADLPPMQDKAHPWGRALGREFFDALLLDRAREVGAVIFQPWLARSIHGGAGAYRCEASAMDSGRTSTLTAPVLILANGSWERALATKRARRKGSDLLAFKANFRGGNLCDGLLPLLSFRGGYGGMVVGDHGVLTLACCIRRDVWDAERRKRPGHKAGEVVESYLKGGCASVRNALRGANREGDWLSVGPIRPGIRMERRGDGPFLIGNAAGEAHPIIGEGISMALQSAWLLCESLIPYREEIRKPEAQDRIRRQYVKAWRRNFAFRIRLAALFAHLAMRPGLFPLLRRWPAILTHGARFSGKVNCSVNEGGSIAPDECV